MTIQPISLTSIGDAATVAPSGSCCGGGSCGVASTPASEGAATDRRELLVEGMTCDHCVRAVSDELSALDGVDGVDIDLVAGGSSRVRIRTSAPVADDAVRAAIDEAGYRLV
ncbi:copper chaperone CopZ [Microbacterium sp. AG1240]|uniref:heavy-metal-associated domain-containing protein n=1 Tax=Microbacterium sp. AG1240 TaxID=2183992 RepID=UPI000F14C688|nr:cation transporter [Microbacterium sp. AG1240]RKT33344.1 copper chaperone CopZ [Microbacterium sp. AG1240]